jgi:lipoprotein-anchoring transpeptidase ErfK/SrfK
LCFKTAVLSKISGKDIMARYRYKPYRKKRIRKGNKRFFILAVAVIIAIFFILNKCRNNDEEVPFIPEDIDQKVETVETIEAPEPLPQPEPEPEPEPSGTASPIKPAPPVDGTNPQARTLIEEALGDITAGQIISARDKLIQAMPMKLSSRMLTTVKAQLAELSKRWLFSRDPYAGDSLTAVYEVQSGDQLRNIAKKHKVPYELLMKINGIKDARKLRAGNKIKVINGPFHAIIYRSTFTMDLYLGNKTYIKTYRIGLGLPGKDTPTGKWRVKIDEKLVDPVWYPSEGGIIQSGDPKNPLGSRWIGLKGIEGEAKGQPKYGVHGTKDPDSIGKRSSRGCIRLHNGEVKEFYDLMMPGISEIRVVD